MDLGKVEKEDSEWFTCRLVVNQELTDGSKLERLLARKTQGVAGESEMHLAR